MNIPDISNFVGTQFQEKHFTIHYPEFYEYLMNNYPDDITFQEKLYWYYNDVNTYQLCPTCGKRLKLINVKKGYQKSCSAKCSNSNPNKIKQIRETQEQRYGGMGYGSKEICNKTKQTCLEKYGVENAMNNKEIRDKQISTIIERYGGQGNASELSRNKYKQTCLEKYGVENPGQSEQIREKIKNTCMEKYGADSYSKTDDFKEKYRKTNNEKYGVNSYTQTEEYKQKSLRTNLEKYGVEHHSKTDEYKEQVKTTSLKKYGVENYSKSEEFVERMKNTCMEKYGVDSYSKTDDFKEKYRKTNNEKYGVDSYTQTEEYRTKVYNTKKLNHTFGSSQLEQDFKAWLDNSGIIYKYQYKIEQYPFACDFYFPDKDVYLEVHGHWSHGDHPFDPTSPDDNKILEDWEKRNTKYYKNAINVWSKSDPYKVEVAKINNINLYCAYVKKLDELINFCNSNNIL